MVAEGYKDTEIGLIPIEWDVVDFKNFFNSVGAKKYQVQKSNYLTNGSYPIIDQGQKFIVGYSDEDDKVYKNTNGVIVFGDHTRIIKFIDFDFVVGADGTQLLKSTDGINQKFSYYVLSNKELTNLGYSRHFKLVKEMKFPLPPLKEQEKIADILSTADDKIDAIASQIQKAETLKRGLLQKLLSEGIGHSEFKDSELGKIPASWEVIPFIELADKKVKHSFTGGPFGSDLKSEHYTNEGVRVIQLQNIGDGSFLNHDFVYTSEKKAEALKTCQIYPNDIILAKMAEPVARACIIPNIESKYLMCSDGIRLHIDKSKYDTHFIFQSINHNRFRNIAIARSTGTTRLRIGLTALKKIPIATPPLEEQRQIAEILSTADEKSEVLRAKKQMYEILKKGLLQKLLSGEVRV